MHKCLFLLKFSLLHIYLVDLRWNYMRTEIDSSTCAIVLSSFILWVQKKYCNNWKWETNALWGKIFWGNILIPIFISSIWKHCSYEGLALAYFLLLQTFWFLVIICGFISSFMGLSLISPTPNIGFGGSRPFLLQCCCGRTQRRSAVLQYALATCLVAGVLLHAPKGRQSYSAQGACLECKFNSLLGAYRK